MEAPARPLKTPAPSLQQALKPIKKKPFFFRFLMSPWLLGEARGCPASRLQLGGGNGWEKLRLSLGAGFCPRRCPSGAGGGNANGVVAYGPFPAT